MAKKSHDIPEQGSLFDSSNQTENKQKNLFGISAKNLENASQDTENHKENLTPDSIDEVSDSAIRSRLASMPEDELAAEIQKHNRLYNEGNPEISDALFDVLTERLRMLNPGHPVLNELTAPAVGDISLGKVKHAIPMLSLEKAKKGEEFKNIETWLKGFEGNFLGSPKIDGLACSIQYDSHGDLVLASTRGNGQVGENITKNVLYIQSIPKHIAIPNLEVRGEVYMPLSAFNAFKGDKISARNLAVGGLKQKDAHETARYHLSFFAYEAIGPAFKTDTEKFETLNNLGFTAIDTKLFVRDEHTEMPDIIQAVRAFCEQMTAVRDTWDFDADGLVFKIDDNETQRSMGMTAHHPKCAIAYKFASDAADTVLRQILWQVAKGGSLTPVAVFDGVELAGAMVKRATLSNVDQVEHFPIYPDSKEGIRPDKAPADWPLVMLKIGDLIHVSRRGDVIPHVEYIVSESDDAQDPAIPDQCVSCGAPVNRDGKFLRCSDPDNCPTTGQALIENYVKVTGMMGLGEKIIASLYDEGMISTPADLYKLTKEQIAAAVQSSENGQIDPTARLPQKLYDSIQNTRMMKLSVFLESLSIPALGKVKSRDLSDKYGTLDNILSFDIEQINPTQTVRKIYDALHRKQPLIDELLSFVKIEPVDIQASSEAKLPFSGMSFLFTGSLASMKREEAQSRVESLGGKAAAGVSKTLSVLVSTATGTTKWKKAEDLNAKGAGIQLWTEDEFLEKLKEAELNKE